MHFLRATLFLPLFPVLVFAQLTTDQKLLEFQNLANVYAKQYAPYEWKKQTQNFDMLDLAPWLAKVRATRNDLEYLNVASEYVSRLNDGHSGFYNVSDFTARLNFAVDIYDGKLLVDFINRTRLPVAEFGFVIGYELISVDGVPAEQLVEKFRQYAISANDRTTRRYAAQMVTTRPQFFNPFAPDVPEISTVVFRRPDGRTESYRIPWTKTGLPIASFGKFPSFTARVQSDGSSDEPTYLRPLRKLQNVRMPERAVVGMGDLLPSFVNGLGSGFTVRLGRSLADPFFSGVFLVGPYRIGFIRVRDFLPVNDTTAEAAFRSEIAFFQANTDGLVVDITRNPGGRVDFANTLLTYLMPRAWQAVGFQVRATSEWIVEISSALEAARSAGAPAPVLAQLQQLFDTLQEANRSNRGLTPPIALDDVTLERDPARSATGTLQAYTKPLMLLADELSASGADMFAASIQDNARGPVFGWRTMGLGGNVVYYYTGNYTGSFAGVTQSLMHRGKDIATPEFPVSPYIENVGVRPDIEYDYMTRSNLARNGADYVEAFLLAMYQHIERSK